MDMDETLDFISQGFVNANDLQMEVADTHPHPDALGFVKV